MKNYKYILEITVFLCGAIVMIFEILASRVLGPYFGTSTFTWTSIIGIILGGLSLGYYFGGKISDKNPFVRVLSLIIFISAIFIILTILSKDLLLSFLQVNVSDIRISSVISSIVLFFPASVMLGMVSPYATKLRLNDMNNAGSAIGNLYAISTAGSICGTFLAGFYFIPKFGTNNLLIILSILLIVVSLFLNFKTFLKTRLLTFLFIIGIWFFLNGFNEFLKKDFFVDVDTEYNRVWIYDYKEEETSRPIRIFSVNHAKSSAVFLDDYSFANEYLKYFHLAKYFNPDFKKTLMIGGAGYLFPMDFMDKYPEAEIDVIEIDSTVTDLARKYFKLKDNPRLSIYHEDGRVYLNNTQKKYDVIFGDAFSSHYSVPYHLTTKEAVKRKFDILNENGLVILNLISSIDGEKGLFFRSEYATYKSIFPQVLVFPVENLNDKNEVGNIILVAMKSKKDLNFSEKNLEYYEYLKNLLKDDINSDVPILTDDYAPVDYYTGKI